MKPTRPRDLYDVAHLGERRDEIQLDAARAIFRQKCTSKGFPAPSADALMTVVRGSAPSPGTRGPAVSPTSTASRVTARAHPCGGSGCHTPDDPMLYSQLFDMRDKSSWTVRAATIHCGIVLTQDPSWNCAVRPETYPKTGFGNPLPTDEALGIVAGWIEAGCP